MTVEAGKRPFINGGRIYGIILPDDRRLELRIGANLLVGDLLDMAATHCNVRGKAKDLFGLAFRDPGYVPKSNTVSFVSTSNTCVTNSRSRPGFKLDFGLL
jgi:hypothetical protein